MPRPRRDRARRHQPVTCSSTGCCCATGAPWPTWSRSTFGPLARCCGPQPLVETLAAYTAAGGNSAATARALHLPVRAVTYRLDRVRELTGPDPTLAINRSLQLAMLGAQLLHLPSG